MITSNAAVTEMIHSVIGSNERLSSVTEYKLVFSRSHPYHQDDLSRTFGTVGWPMLGRNLLKLSISCPLDQIPAVLPSGTLLRNLRDLSITCSLVQNTNSVLKCLRLSSMILDPFILFDWMW